MHKSGLIDPEPCGGGGGGYDDALDALLPVFTYHPFAPQPELPLLLWTTSNC